jgi:hypothetical protein
VNVYRVRFAGGELTGAAEAALRSAGGRWEGSSHGPAVSDRHRALMRAPTLQQAIAGVREALAGHGSFADYEAEVVTDARGRPWDGPLERGCEEIDWRAIAVSDLQRAVLWAVLDDVEATWLIEQELDGAADRRAIERALAELEERGLVYHWRARAMRPDGPDDELDRWWGITHAGWDLLGMIRSPGYARGMGEPPSR